MKDNKPKSIWNIPDVIMGALILSMALFLAWYGSIFS